jgi:hypothetical protein
VDGSKPTQFSQHTGPLRFDPRGWIESLDQQTSKPLGQTMITSNYITKKMPRLVSALRERFAKRAMLEKQVNANMEGMGYGG